METLTYTFHLANNLRDYRDRAYSMYTVNEVVNKNNKLDYLKSEVEKTVVSKSSKHTYSNYTVYMKLNTVYKINFFGLYHDRSYNDKYVIVRDVEIGLEILTLDEVNEILEIKKEIVMKRHTSNTQIHFGKYQGMMLTDITDKNYLNWVVNNFTKAKDAELVAEIKLHLENNF